MQDILALRAIANITVTTAEIRRYTHNIPTFLRLHRFVSGGVSALSTRGLGHLSKILAVLNSPSALRTLGRRESDDSSTIDPTSRPFVTPSLVAMAARKVYPHRIELVKRPEDERSMQWGSKREAVAEALKGVTVDGVLEEILDKVECPL